MHGVPMATTIEEAWKEFDLELTGNGWAVLYSDDGIVAKKCSKYVSAEVFYRAEENVVGFRVLDGSSVRENNEGSPVFSEYDIMLTMHRFALGIAEPYFR